MKFNIFAVVLLTLLFGGVGSAEAAYIDPNTGGMIFQILAAGFALFSGFILMFASKIKMFFARMKRKKRDVKAPQS